MRVPRRYSLLGHVAPVTCCDVSPSSADLVSGSKDATLRLWDLKTGRLRHSLERHEGHVTCCAVGKDGVNLASGSADKWVA